MRHVFKRIGQALNMPSIWMLVFLVLFHATTFQPSMVIVSGSGLNIPLHDEPLVIEANPSQLQGVSLEIPFTRDGVQQAWRWRWLPFRSGYLLELDIEHFDAGRKARVLEVNDPPGWFVFDLIVAAFDKSNWKDDLFSALERDSLEDVGDLSSLPGFLGLMVPVSFEYTFDQDGNGFIRQIMSNSSALVVPSGTDLRVWVGINFQSIQENVSDSFPQKITIELSSPAVVIDFPTYIVNTYVNFAFLMLEFIVLFYIIIRFLVFPTLSKRSNFISIRTKELKSLLNRVNTRFPRHLIYHRLGSWKRGFKELADNYLLPLVLFFSLYILFLVTTLTPKILSGLALRKGQWRLEGSLTDSSSLLNGMLSDTVLMMPLLVSFIFTQLIVLLLFILPLVFRAFQRSMRESEIRDVLFSLPITPTDYHHQLRKQVEGIILLAFFLPSVLGALVGLMVTIPPLDAAKVVLDGGTRVITQGVFPLAFIFLLMVVFIEGFFVLSLLSWIRLMMAIQQVFILKKPRFQAYLLMMSVVGSLGSLLFLIGLDDIAKSGNVNGSWGLSALFPIGITNFLLVALPGGAALTFWNFVTMFQPFPIITDVFSFLDPTTITIVSIIMKAALTLVMVLLSLVLVGKIEHELLLVREGKREENYHA